MSELIALPDGDFVDANAVTSIKHYEAGNPEGTQSRIILITSDRALWCFEFGDDREAMLDCLKALGRAINEARRKSHLFRSKQC